MFRGTIMRARCTRCIAVLFVASVTGCCSCRSNDTDEAVMTLRKGEYLETKRGGYIYLADVTRKEIVFKRTGTVAVPDDELSTLKPWVVPVENREPWYHIGSHEHLYIVDVDVTKKTLTVRLTSDAPKGILEAFNF